MKLRSLVTLIALATVGVSIGAIGTHYLSYRRTPAMLPSIGDRVPLDFVESAFGTTLGHGSWLLLLSPSCGACLALDTELADLKKNAMCANADLVPLLVETANPSDSINIILAKHGLFVRGAGSPDAFRTIGVRVVPALIELNEDGRIQRVSSPAKLNSWPRTSTCQ